MIAELPEQMPNCVPSAEHTNAPGLEQAVPDAAPADPVEPVEPAEAPAAGVAAGVAAAAAEGEARIVAVPGTAAEGDAGWACPAAAEGTVDGEAADAEPALEPAAALLEPPHLGPVGGLVWPVPAFCTDAPGSGKARSALSRVVQSVA